MARAYGKVTTIGTDKARLAWIKATWRERGVVVPALSADALVELERVGRSEIDRAMRAIATIQAA